MSQDSLQRLREDLQTRQAATGLDFPSEPAHVRTAYVFALAALAAATLAWLARTQALRSGTAMLIICAIVGAHLLTAATKDRRLRSWYVSGAGANAKRRS